MRKINVDFKTISNQFFEGETKQEIVKIYGYITNFHDVFPTMSSSEIVGSISKLVSEGKCLFEIFDGEFVILVKSKINGRYYICPNYYSSYPIYYYDGGTQVCISSSIKYIYDLVKNEETIDIKALKMLMSYGFLLGDTTPITGIKKLIPGHDLTLDSECNLNFRKLRDFRRTEEAIGAVEVLDELDNLFDKAICKIFDFANNYSTINYTTLSGGLDSRMTFLGSQELGFDSGTLVTFGELDSLDVKIASQIASDNNKTLIVNSIDGGDYLSDSEFPVKLNEGTALYSGAAHTLNTLRKLKLTDNTIVHTGQLGDAVLGSFSDTSIRPVSDETLLLGAYNRDYIKRNLDCFRSYLEPYEINEQFLFYNRAFNGANNGLNTIGRLCCFSSPFMDRDFFDFCLKIPSKLMHGERIYLDWINKKRPEYTNYVWEKWRLKPRSKYFRLANSKAYKYGKYKLFEVTLKQGMNPFQKWKSNNSVLVDGMVRKILDFEDKALLEEVLSDNVNNFICRASLINLIQAVTVVEVCNLYD